MITLQGAIEKIPISINSNIFDNQPSKFFFYYNYIALFKVYEPSPIISIDLNYATSHSESYRFLIKIATLGYRPLYNGIIMINL